MSEPRTPEEVFQLAVRFERDSPGNEPTCSGCRKAYVCPDAYDMDNIGGVCVAYAKDVFDGIDADQTPLHVNHASVDSDGKITLSIATDKEEAK